MDRERGPLILMTGSFDVAEGRDLERVYYYKNYPEALERCGATVLNVSRCDGGTARRLAALADGLYLTGGGDMEPRYYGEERLLSCGEPEKGRDELELALVRAFLEVQKPILGICRGLQVLNVVLGGTLWQDLPTQTGRGGHGEGVHTVRTAEGSRLRSFFGAEFPVNSFHHQAVRQLAPGLVPTAWEEPGELVEAFAHESLPLWAVQWHPERMTGAERYTREGPDMGPLFQFFCDRCRR